MTLKAELNLILGTALALALAAAALASGAIARRFYRVEVVEAKGRAMARALATPCAKALAAGTAEELERFLSDQKAARPDEVQGSEVDLVAIAVVDAAGVVRAAIPFEDRDDVARSPLVHRALAVGEPLVQEGDARDRFGPHGEALLEIAAPLRSDGVLRGVLWFALSLERARSLYAATLVWLVGTGAAGTIVLWFSLYKVLKRRILTPVTEISRALERVRQGDLTARVGTAREDEIGSLVRSFDAMVGMLRERATMTQKLDEAERTAEAHRRLAEAHRELADAHTALQATQERLILEEKHASLGRLIQGVAHEINNPLNSASNAIPALRASLDRLRTTFTPLLTPDAQLSLDPKGAADALEDVKDVESACDVIGRGVSRAVAILHDLRAFSRLGSADLADVDLARTILDAVQACAAELGPAGRVSVDVDVSGPHGAPIVLRAFPTLLGQVFVNLLTNAAQALPGPGVVSIVARVRGDRARIEVKDTGPGIRPEHLSRLFEPFFTTKEAGHGTGLGLALCHGIVEKHGGTIDAASEPGKGAVFTLELPLIARPEAPGQTGSGLLEGRRGDSVAAVAMRARRG